MYVYVNFYIYIPLIYLYIYTQIYFIHMIYRF